MRFLTRYHVFRRFQMKKANVQDESALVFFLNKRIVSIPWKGYNMNNKKTHRLEMEVVYMCTKKELEFSIFVIYHLSASWKKSPAEVYRILNCTSILDDYIIKCYDTLHTLGANYLVEDITDFVKEKGVQI